MFKILSKKRLRPHLLAAPIVLLAGASSALAADGPIGTWIDHTGRGAVEISDCNGALCGRIVWLKAAGDQEACGMQIIGNAKPVSGGKWDGGWIYDPEAKSKYDVELTPLGEQKLKVLGYAGTKMFGETMMWTRAPADLARCDARTAAAPNAETPREELHPSAPPAAARPERQADTSTPSESRPRKSKDCGITIDGLGKFSFPCPE